MRRPKITETNGENDYTFNHNYKSKNKLICRFLNFGFGGSTNGGGGASSGGSGNFLFDIIRVSYASNFFFDNIKYQSVNQNENSNSLNMCVI